MHNDERRQQLLRVAIETFANKGFSGTKTKDIAAAAGVSEAILFRHFATKEDLYHAILDSKKDDLDYNAFLHSLQDYVQRRDDRNFFRLLADRVANSFRNDPAFHRLMLYASLEGHLFENLFRERFALPMGDVLECYVTLRQKEGAFRKGNPKFLVLFAMGTFVHFAMHRYVLGTKKIPFDDTAAMKELVNLVLGGLIADGNKGSKTKRNHNVKS